MQLTHSTRLNFNQRRGDIFGSWEHARIGNPDGSAFGLDRFLCEHSVTQGLRHGSRARNLVGAERSWYRSRKNVTLTRVGSLAKKCGGDTKIFGQHIIGRVFEPIGDQESIVLVEVAVVEYEKELGAVRIEALNGVWNP